ncbi:hypothetical protein TUMSATVNIG1_34260 [Vibrio nigripulchritudo]|nr:hypothetical protein VNTUMSATTG_33970 [Vibrio nigripulchritudo]BDU32817.1 hypothetical protein TUMSATVNIG1_34260 [Vibrio nigripulchritudo]
MMLTIKTRLIHLSILIAENFKEKYNNNTMQSEYDNTTHIIMSLTLYEKYEPTMIKNNTDNRDAYKGNFVFLWALKAEISKLLAPCIGIDIAYKER